MGRDARQRKEMAIDEDCARKTDERRGQKKRAESAARKLPAQDRFFNC